MINLEDRFYTSTEVADILGVSLRSIYRYLEEDKITAEVKTATGRHRFTRQNIIDFLYPNPQDQQAKESAKQQATASNTAQQAVPQAPTITPQSTDAPATAEQEQKEVSQEATSDTAATDETQKEDSSDEVQTADTSSAQEETKEETQESKDTSEEAKSDSDEQVDWLAKFKQAADKYKQEQTEQPAKAQEAETPATEEKSVPVDNIAGKTAAPVEESKPVEQEAATTTSATEMYYRSNVGGLKDIAQAVDKTAKKSSVPYAFTLNAGLSLHKPIKPFSLLHVYVRPQDRDFFEKSLQLASSGKESAQLCLRFTDDGNVYSNVEEMHGLAVVASERLKKDLVDAGEGDLAGEL